MPNIRRHGKKWQACIKYRKQTVYRTFETKAIAERESQNILRRLQSGENPDKYDPTLEEAINKYLNEVGSLQADTGKTRRESNKNTINKYLGKYTLRALNADFVIERFVHPRLQSDGVSPDTVRRELSLLSQTFQHSRFPNPVPEIRRTLFRQRKLAPPAKRDRRLSEGEEKKLLKACSSIDSQLRLIVELVLHTGLRRSEVAHLTKQDLQGTKLTIQPGKTNRLRQIPLCSHSQQLLSKMAKEQQQQLILLSPQLISRKFKQACDDAKIQDLKFHDLRGEFAHRCLEGKIYNRKCTIDEVAKILGNSVRVLEQHYANQYRFEGLV